MSVVLYPHQVECVKRHIQLLKSRAVTSDRSETGTGKTVSILQAAKELEVPFAIICPKTLISHWRRWCRLDGAQANHHRGLGSGQAW